MIVLFVVITAIYVVFISILFVAYGKVKSFNSISEHHKTRFTIVIPFRNESKNFEALLNSISLIKYSKSLYEIILVNDDSEDNSVDIIEYYLNKVKGKDFAEISIINNRRLSNSPKKDAIQTAVLRAKFEWIVTTDADCVVPSLWLQNFDVFINEKSPKLIVAPVTYKTSNTFLDNFQLHDFLSLQTATVGGFGIRNPILCNGANLCYAKSTFIELKGFDGNNNIASGDDLFFMEKVVEKYPNDVQYIKSQKTTVLTIPEPTWKALLNQRIRWASKTSSYNNVSSKVLAFVVLLMNASLVACFVFTILGLLSWEIFSVFFIIKFSIDFFFILRSSNFFNQNNSLFYYPLNSLMYPFFAVAVSFYSMFFKYQWKGRSFKK
ncbi:MAG: glycosyltransferase [Bacteroidetes bacterium]|nr:MAG: glycosyltransferase [Bacteroidota bacterium]